MTKAQTHKKRKSTKNSGLMVTKNTRKLCPSLDFDYNVNLNTILNTISRYNMKPK